MSLNIANDNAPRYVRFFEKLPKTVTGKFQKVSLRSMLKDEFA